MKTIIKVASILFSGLVLLLASCKKKDDSPTAANIIFKFKFDSTQVRLNNIGQPATIPGGHAAQTPKFNKMSAHYIEFAPSALTALGTGAILYRAPEVTTGGANAIDFDQSVKVAEGETFLAVPIKSVNPGSYEWIRVSLSYQNYDIKYKYNVGGNIGTSTGTLASFIGFRTYIKSYLINTKPVTENANKDQGYWGFETFGLTFKGQAPAGATTVPNPLFASSPIPSGSCVVTGPFSSPLVITGNETQDIVITLSLSIDKSFEWIDTTSPDGWYQPDTGDVVVDMGVRGLIPIVN